MPFRSPSRPDRHRAFRDRADRRRGHHQRPAAVRCHPASGFSPRLRRQESCALGFHTPNALGVLVTLVVWWAIIVMRLAGRAAVVEKASNQADRIRFQPVDDQKVVVAICELRHDEFLSFAPLRQVGEELQRNGPR